MNKKFNKIAILRMVLKWIENILFQDKEGLVFDVGGIKDNCYADINGNSIDLLLLIVEVMPETGACSRLVFVDKNTRLQEIKGLHLKPNNPIDE